MPVFNFEYFDLDLSIEELVSLDPEITREILEVCIDADQNISNSGQMLLIFDPHFPGDSDGDDFHISCKI